MDVHSLVAPYIGFVNPSVPARIARSTGFTTDPSGKRSPIYSLFPISAQVQALTFSDLTQLDGLNIEGVRRAVYLKGNSMAVVRPLQRGGDLVLFQPGTLPEGDVWLVAQVLEQWADWVKIAITLQNNTLSDIDPDG